MSGTIFFSKQLAQIFSGIFFVLSFALAQAAQVTAGSTVMMSVTADGTAPFSYQWKKNGINVVGATAATLTITNIQSTNAGSYSVQVANTAGSTTSDINSITVTVAPASIPAPPVGFDWQGYLARNPDLIAGYGYTQTGAWSHYYNFGLYEGRVFDNLFRVDEYLALNPDLQTGLGSNRQAAVWHWLMYGETEGRFGRVPLNFDSESYLTRNLDLLAGYGHNKVGLWLHYWDHGIFEGRVFDDLFRVDEYLALNLDLQTGLGGNRQAAVWHWLMHGEMEGRLGRVPANFDSEGYLTRNQDLLAGYGHNKVGLWRHYWGHGIFEGRVFDDLFRVDEYLALNPDLQTLGNNRQAVVWHWLMHGKTEGRLGRVPLNFDSEGYLTRNQDLLVGYGHNKLGLWLHYWDHGIFEGRVFDDLFRVDEYLALNSDLQAAFGTDRQAAALHWLIYGKSEGRHAHF